VRKKNQIADLRGSDLKTLRPSNLVNDEVLDIIISSSNHFRLSIITLRSWKTSICCQEIVNSGPVLLLISSWIQLEPTEWMTCARM